MIDKRLPRYLNNSLDSRIRGVDEMIDALNVLITGDSGFSADGNTTGDAGVLKPIKGNGVVPNINNYFEPLYQKVVIGAVEDVKYGYIYFFLYSQLASEMGVYRIPIIGDDAGAMQRVFSSAQFNFDADGFVKADIVHINPQNASEEERTILYFTDNKNEPRRLDVNRVLADQWGVDYDQFDIEDAICACPKSPVYPPTWNFTLDPDRDKSLFEGAAPFQYAYQNIYYSGEESAISTYSTYAVPPSELNQGNSTDIVVENTCTIRVPREGYSREVEYIRLLAKNFETKTFYIIDEVRADVTDGANFTEFTFFNDRILTGVPEFEVTKQFDNLPRRALAQTTSENRLFYGNYVEGFDQIEVDAKLAVGYRERGQDFQNSTIKLEPKVFNVSDPSFLNQGEITNVASGFRISQLNFPATVPAGTIINLNVVIYPKKNFAIYDGRTSFHPIPLEGNTESIPGSNAVIGDPNVSVSSIYLDAPNGASDLDGMPSVLYAGCFNNEPTRNLSSFGGSSSATWHVEAGDLAGTAVAAAYGTSSENALMIKGTSLNFSLSVEVNTPITSANANLPGMLINALTGNQVPQFNVIENSTTYSYSYDLNIPNKAVIDYTDSEYSLISGVVRGGSNLNGTSTPIKQPPLGSIIVNSADVNFRIVKSVSDPVAFVLDVVSIDNVTTKTCIPDLLIDKSSSQGELANWVAPKGVHSRYLVLDPDLILQTTQEPNFISENFSGSQFINGGQLFDFSPNQIDLYPHIAGLSLGQVSTTDLPAGTIVTNSVKRIFGRLSLTNPENSIVTKYEDRGFTYESSAISILDGAVGPGGNGAGIFSQQMSQFVSGTGGIFQTISPALHTTGVHSLSVLPYLVVNTGSLGTGSIDQFEFSSIEAQPYSVSWLADSEEDQLGLGSLESAYFNVFTTGLDGDSDPQRSFKANANHAFGIVYYDQRGRSSNVMPLGSVFVRGLGERFGQNLGASFVSVEIFSDPPPWAYNYQVVYTGNTSVSKFVQYTAGGAYSDGDKIYVSLNYLQGSKNSYVNAFGAKSPIGDNRLYQYQPGDRLRIISYNPVNENGTSRPPNYDFEVIEFVTLTDDPSSNPIYEEGDNLTDGNQPKVGDFVVLKNRPDLVDFSVIAIEGGSDKWNNRCLVELYSPSKFSDLEDKPYYEISDVRRTVINDFGVLEHEDTFFLLTEGDVFWRLGAIKMPPYDIGVFENDFQDMVFANNDSFSNFYIESETYNDLVRFSNVDNRGKIKAIIPNSQEARRSASITYGEANIYSSNLIKFTSFNQTLGNYKDLPNSFGSINYINSSNEFMICIQDSKTSRIPVNRNILSDASTQQQLIASVKVLGEQSFFSGDYGANGHPESVLIKDDDVYFADTGAQEVLRLNRLRGSISPISSLGMKEFFERAFDDVYGQNPRIVTGFDPVNEEFLISIYAQEPLETFDEFELVQPPRNEIDEEFEDTGGDTGGDPGGDVVDDGGGGAIKSRVISPDSIDSIIYGPSTPKRPRSLGNEVKINSLNDLISASAAYSFRPTKSVRGATGPVDPMDPQLIVDFWTQIYTSGPNNPVYIPEWDSYLSYNALDYIGGFYNTDWNAAGSSAYANPINAIENKGFIDLFGAGIVKNNDLLRRAGVYTDREFLRAASRGYVYYNSLSEEEQNSNPNYNPPKFFSPQFVPCATVTERVWKETTGGPKGGIHNQNLIPHYENGTVNLFGKYSRINSNIIADSNPLSQYDYEWFDASIHGGVLAQIDYMTWREYFKFKLNSVSPKFGIKSNPDVNDIDENDALFFTEMGGAMGKGQSPHPSWAPCACGSYQEWTENIVIPFFEQYMNQPVAQVMNEIYESGGLDGEYNNSQGGHYSFFQNIIDSTSEQYVFNPLFGDFVLDPGGDSIPQILTGGIFNNQPTWGPLVYDFDMDGVWTENDLNIWLSMTQVWTSLGDGVDNPYKPASYYSPVVDAYTSAYNLWTFSGLGAAIGAIEEVFNETGEISVLGYDAQPPGFYNYMVGLDNLTDSIENGPFDEEDLPFDWLKTRKLWNWHESLTQIPPSYSGPTQGVSIVGQNAPYFNNVEPESLPLWRSEFYQLGIGSASESPYYEEGKYGWRDIYTGSGSQNYFTTVNAIQRLLESIQRPSDGFFPLTKYWQ